MKALLFLCCSIFAMELLTVQADLAFLDKTASVLTPSRMLSFANQMKPILERPFEKSTPLLNSWKVEFLPWKDLSDELRFFAFKRIFKLEDPLLTLKEFKASIKEDMPGIRRKLQHKLDSFHGIVEPGQLFWISLIPKAQRTQYERGFMNNFGFNNEFDHVTYDRRAVIKWDTQSLSVKAFRIANIPDLKHELWLKDFRVEIQKIFGKAEVDHAVAAMSDLQSWIISYFYHNYGRLTAEQKAWGLSYFSSLKSPEGIDAYQELIIQIALQHHLKNIV